MQSDDMDDEVQWFANLFNQISLFAKPMDDLKRYAAENLIDLQLSEGELSPIESCKQLMYFHDDMLASIKQQALQNMAEAEEEPAEERDRQLQYQLSVIFNLVEIDEIQPLVMRLMTILPAVDECYLKHLASNDELYSKTTLLVKRKIWCNDEHFYEAKIDALLSQYNSQIASVTESYMDNGDFSVFSALYRQPVVEELTMMIGDCLPLLEVLLRYLMHRWFRYDETRYGEIIADLSIALADNALPGIPYGRSVMLLARLTSSQNFTVNALLELQRAYDNFSQQQYIHFLIVRSHPQYLRKLIRTLFLHASKEITEEADIEFLLRLITLAIPNYAYSSLYIDSHEMLMSVWTVMHQLLNAETTCPAELHRTTTQLRKHVRECRWWHTFALYYLLHSAELRDTNGIIRIITILSGSITSESLENPFLYMLVDQLIRMPDAFQCEDFCVAIFDEFLFPGIHCDPVWHAQAKLLWHVQETMPACRRPMLIEFVQPRWHCTEKMWATCAELQQRFGFTDTAPMTVDEADDNF